MNGKPVVAGIGELPRDVLPSGIQLGIATLKEIHYRATEIEAYVLSQKGATLKLNMKIL